MRVTPPYEIEIEKLVIRISPTIRGDRAILVALGKNGKEYTFEYRDNYNGYNENLFINEILDKK